VARINLYVFGWGKAQLQRENEIVVESLNTIRDPHAKFVSMARHRTSTHLLGR